MDLDSMLAELREAREQVEEAILALERLAGGARHSGGKRPEWLSAIVGEQSSEAQPKPARRNPRKRSPKQSSGQDVA